jgi:E3 ubiquitin-protein ligase MARCH6
MIWIPPNFRLRISIFIVMLWLFAATTGVGCTIVPLLFGRQLFSRILPSDFRINDIYAFLIGAYLLGGPLYFAVRFRKPVVESFSRLVFSPPSVSHYRQASARGLQRLSRFSLRALRLVYFYTAFSVLLPALFAILFEVYLLIPAHTYLSAPPVHAKFALTGSPFNTTLSSNPFLQLPSSITSSLPPKSFTPQLPTNNSSSFTSVPPAPHTIHFVQDWTLGVLAIKVLAGLLLRAYPGARPSLALRALVNPGNRGAGWLNPDIRLATRGFILPALVVMLTALLVPLASGWIANFTLSALQIEGSDDPSRRALVYRFAYPFMLGSGLLFTLGRLAIIALQNWRAVVRDEVYLIGERLHNFGERKVVVGEAKQKDKGKGKERERERADSGTQTDDGPSAAIAGPSFQPENTAEELSSGMIDRAQTL